MIAEPSIRLIIAVVSATFEVPVRDIVSPRRTADIMIARHAVYWLSTELTRQSFPAIARRIGDRDHTSVISGKRTAEAALRTSPSFRTLVGTAREAILTLAASRFAAAFGEGDAVTAAEAILRDPRQAAIRTTANDLQALAAHLLALDEVATLTVQLLGAIDAFVRPDTDPLQRGELSQLARTLISNLNRAFDDIASVRANKTETTHAEGSTQGKDDGDTAPGAAVA